MDSEPALPWGVAADAQRAIIRDLPAQMTLVVGSARIEVFWVLELADEDEEESQETTSYGKWWPATILRLDENGTTDGEGRIAYILCYDPDPESGYDEHTEHNVTFLDEHELFDIEEGEILMWRHECDDWNEVDKYRTEDGRYVISLEQIIEEDDKLARLVGIQPKSIREEMASCMEGMPMDVLCR